MPATLHLLKLCVGADGVEDLISWQAERIGRAPRRRPRSLRLPRHPHVAEAGRGAHRRRLALLGLQGLGARPPAHPRPRAAPRRGRHRALRHPPRPGGRPHRPAAAPPVPGLALPPPRGRAPRSRCPPPPATCRPSSPPSSPSSECSDMRRTTRLGAAALALLVALPAAGAPTQQVRLGRARRRVLPPDAGRRHRRPAPAHHRRPRPDDRGGGGADPSSCRRSVLFQSYTNVVPECEAHTRNAAIVEIRRSKPGGAAPAWSEYLVIVPEPTAPAASTTSSSPPAAATPCAPASARSPGGTDYFMPYSSYAGSHS